MIYRLCAILPLLLGVPAAAETVTFPAADGVTVTADLEGQPGQPMLVLFHMAGSSRGEYREIAPRLHALGYATLAVDQRSGRVFDGVQNATAAGVGPDPGYLAAIADLEAATAYVREQFGATRVGAIGSSYSASLVLVLAGRDPGFADAVMAFSPGEYFSDNRLVVTAAGAIRVPVFLTAARREAGQWRAFFEAVRAPKTSFVPSGGGKHGATALISADGAEYWTALEQFLAAHLPAD